MLGDRGEGELIAGRPGLNFWLTVSVMSPALEGRPFGSQNKTSVKLHNSTLHRTEGLMQKRVSFWCLPWLYLCKTKLTVPGPKKSAKASHMLQYELSEQLSYYVWLGDLRRCWCGGQSFCFYIICCSQWHHIYRTGLRVASIISFNPFNCFPKWEAISPDQMDESARERSRSRICV